MDTDGDGYISVIEFEVLLESYGMFPGDVNKLYRDLGGNMYDEGIT